MLNFTEGFFEGAKENPHNSRHFPWELFTMQNQIKMHGNGNTSGDSVFLPAGCQKNRARHNRK